MEYLASNQSGVQEVWSFFEVSSSSPFATASNNVADRNSLVGAPEFVDKTTRDNICLVMGTPNVTEENSSSAMASRSSKREDSSGLQLVICKTSSLSIM